MNPTNRKKLSHLRREQIGATPEQRAKISTAINELYQCTKDLKDCDLGELLEFRNYYILQPRTQSRDFVLSTLAALIQTKYVEQEKDVGKKSTSMNHKKKPTGKSVWKIEGMK